MSNIPKLNIPNCMRNKSINIKIEIIPIYNAVLRFDKMQENNIDKIYMFCYNPCEGVVNLWVILLKVLTSHLM